MYVVNQHISIEIAAIEPASPPRVERFVRRQGHPAESRAAKAHADVKTAKPEERYQRRAPIMPSINGSRIPAPAVGCAVEPAAVVVWCPAPWIVAHPGPSIPVFPNPAPLTVRRPIRADRRAPNPAVGRHIHPAAVCIKILGAIDVPAHVLRAAGPGKIAVAVFAPAVEVIERIGGDYLKFRIGRSAPYHHGFPGVHF